MNKTAEIIRRRLFNQQISATKFQHPDEIVSYMGAMQAQEYAMAKWAIGLRLGNSSDSVIEKAFNEGKILRTHLLRPTWHFVSPKDIRWLLELTAPQIIAINKSTIKQTDLTPKTLAKGVDIILPLLRDNNFKTRDELRPILLRKKIIKDAISLSYILMQAELDALICSGPRKGNQFTYALLDERVPEQKKITRAESLVKLAGIYFKSRGPATIKDFSYWSGLNLKDCRSAVEAIKNKLEKELINGTEYYFTDLQLPSVKKLQTSFLMPDYDEYIMSYGDRSAILPKQKIEINIRGDNPVFNRMIVIDGVVRGTWKRKLSKNETHVETFPFTELNASQQSKLNSAIKRFQRFYLVK